ncbi:MAG: electron transfer flavoprotein subunit alpha/FixB family protein [Deltaproteobacteria bacterium]|nr:electron transfer flavoprotein subunit alpha/FixB family protein [Deltaproteobacteria bacterium]
MDDVLILGEIKEGALDPRSLELIAIGEKLAEDLGSNLSILVLGDSPANAAAEASSYGPAKVYSITHSLLKDFQPEIWLAALEKACQEIKPAVFLMSHSFMGRELGPRLACRLGARLTTDCIDLAVDPQDKLLLRTKPVSGGNAIAVFKCPGPLQMATVRGKVFSPVERTEGHAEVVEINVQLDQNMAKVTSLEIVKEEVVALDKADVVISGGAGLGEKEGFEILEDLRKVLSKTFGSVMIGCSRVAVDKGWISSDHQVGLTGTMISPDIYVAIGISGAIQHLVGMVHSKKIIAINTDASCNMFKVADYGVVEDYEKIIPALITKLEDRS